VETRHGRTVIVLDGEPVSQAAYCDYILRGDWDARVREFADSGVCVYHLQVPHGDQGRGHDFFDGAFWVDDHVFPEDDFPCPLSLDRQAEIVLGHCPHARFYVKTWLSPPIRWTETHADQMLTAEDGRRFREPCWASPPYLAGLARALATAVRFCESRPWADRIVGYLPIPYGEGCTLLTCGGWMFDQSAAAAAGFRAWLRARYDSDAALQAAWADPAATLASAAVPRDSEWLRKRREAVPHIEGQPIASFAANCPSARPAGLFHWLEPAQAAREHDYCRFMRDALAHWLRTVVGAIRGACAEAGVRRVVLIDALKQPLLGWQIQSAFDGIGDGQSFPNMLQLSGSWDVGPILDASGLDGLVNPADYTARTVGFALESEGLTDSLPLRGMTAMVENDARTYVGQGVHEQGAFRTPREVEAGLLRNAALPLSRGWQSYWCNVGSSYFHDAGIQKTVRQLVPLLDRLNRAPHRETRDAVAMVIDDGSPMFEDFTSGYQSLAVIWQRVKGLALCGVPYRLYLLSDLEKETLPACKVWLFPNLFKVDEPVLRLLRQRVLRDGNVALFGPATGITDGRILTAGPASALLGVPMELLPRTTVRHVLAQDAGHAISRELPAGFVYGDSLPYGPTLVPREWAVETHGATPLGHANLCWFIHRTGLFIKEFGRGAAGSGQPGARGDGDYAAIWSVAMPLPPELLRACARHAGCHVWSEQNHQIYASGSLVSLHTVKTGRHTVRLPRACRVRDALSGECLGRTRVRRIVVECQAAPETRVFLLED
jgi:hypothetical protein